MLEHGALMARHNGSPASARRVLGQLFGRSGVTLSIQDQFVNQRLPFERTDAGAAVTEEIDGARRRVRAEMQETIDNLAKEKDEVMKAAWRTQQEELRTQAKSFEEAAAQLKEDRTKEVAELRKQIEVTSAGSGKTTQDYIWEGVSAPLLGGFFSNFVTAAAHRVFARLLG